MQYLGYCTVCNTSNPSRSFNPTVPYLDTSPKDKKTILPLKNLTPAHSVSGLPAHYFIKHKLKFSLSHSLSLPRSCVSSIHCHSCMSFNPLPQLHLLQSKPLSLPSLLLPKLRRSFKLIRFRRRQRRPISLFNNKTSSLFLVCEAVPSPNSHGVKVSLFLVPLFPLSLPIYLCACLLCIRIFFFFLRIVIYKII